MKLENLETVLIVSNKGSFSSAADIIPCSQSSVSRQIKNVENELGVILFTRSSNSNTVILTEEGEYLLPLIHHIVDAYGELLEHSISSHQSKLTLGLETQTFSSSSKGILMSSLYLSHPTILFNMKELPTKSHFKNLVIGNVDAILFGRPFKHGCPEKLLLEDASLRCIPLGCQALSVAVWEHHHLSNVDSINLASLKKDFFIFDTDIRKNYDPQDSNYRHSFFIEACHEAGFEPEIKTVNRDLADIKLTMTVEEQGIFPSTIPSFLREYSGIKYLPVKDSPYYVQYYLMSLSTNKNPALKELTEFLLERFKATE